MTNRPLLPGRLSGTKIRIAQSSIRRTAPAVAIAFAAALVVGVPAVASPSIASKQAEAQSVLGEIQSLDSSLERAIEAYNFANVKLERIRRDLKRNEGDLHVARVNYKRAQKMLSTRLVQIYTSDSGNTTLEVMLGSSSLDDMLNRIDTVNRVSSQDARVVRQVIKIRREIQKRELRLKKAKQEQADVVAERAAAKASVERQLGARQSLLSSIKGEIAQMQAAEAARQAQLRRAAAAAATVEQQQAGAAALSGGIGPVSGSTGTTTPPPPATKGGVVGIAMQYLGVPYVWGGATPSGFDCSGFTMYVYAQVGVSLPHSTYAQYAMGTPVSRDQLAPGDLVFFNGLGHMGIYIGGGSMIHAPHSGDVVKISSMSGWYASTYVGARRL
ncbi:MAG: NlpC/P60 family protein [Actinomycetota bacterium]|nr:NlpC/P60 family protein [Actinomycetota bacterium]